MKLQVTGFDDIYVTVSDLRRSEAFYDGVMRLLGFRKGTGQVDGEALIHYYTPHCQYTLRSARPGATTHDPLAPGLNHLCFQLADAGSVDAAAHGLRALGVPVTEPRFYPEYAPDHYAIHFTDPDGIRLEIVSRTRLRNIIVKRWGDLDTFENPLRKIGAV